jgi:hypothetical protein
MVLRRLLAAIAPFDRMRRARFPLIAQGRRVACRIAIGPRKSA